MTFIIRSYLDINGKSAGTAEVFDSKPDGTHVYPCSISG
jgi:hypothetical protein